MNKLMNFCSSNPYKPLSENEILAELSESKMLYDDGEGEEFGKLDGLKCSSFSFQVITDCTFMIISIQLRG